MTTDNQAINNFEQLDLIEPLRRALADQNYVTPTAIQAKTIPHALEGRDVLGCAQTGTGKTAAFALPILNYFGDQFRKAEPNQPQALVLAPTRELAIQIGDSFKTYGKHLKLRHVLVFGGVNQNQQVRALQQGAHVLVATPGRLLDLMQQGYVDLSQLEVFVLDEADRMLDMGFLPDLKRIIQKLPKDRQSLFFSATMPPKITELAGQLLFNPISVNVTPKSTSVKRIDQQLIFAQKDEKQKVLESILRGKAMDRAIVFTRTKRGANQVTRKLENSGFRAAVIHGNKSQNARQKALEAFRSHRVDVLVATDVAARGIDIDNVTHVVNYDLPNEPEAYVHRIGRTGRAGAEGIAISLCSSFEMDDLRAIEDLIGNRIPFDQSQTPPTPERKAKPSGGGRGRRGGGGQGSSNGRRTTAGAASRSSSARGGRPGGSRSTSGNSAGNSRRGRGRSSTKSSAS